MKQAFPNLFPIISIIDSYIYTSNKKDILPSYKSNVLCLSLKLHQISEETPLFTARETSTRVIIQSIKNGFLIEEGNFYRINCFSFLPSVACLQ